MRLDSDRGQSMWDLITEGNGELLQDFEQKIGMVGLVF